MHNRAKVSQLLSHLILAVVSFLWLNTCTMRNTTANTTPEFTAKEQATIETLVSLGDSRELAVRTVRHNKTRVIKFSPRLPRVMVISAR